MQGSAPEIAALHNKEIQVSAALLYMRETEISKQSKLLNEESPLKHGFSAATTTRFHAVVPLWAGRGTLGSLLLFWM